jgi:hypothetical protein
VNFVCAILVVETPAFTHLTNKLVPLFLVCVLLFLAFVFPNHHISFSSVLINLPHHLLSSHPLSPPGRYADTKTSIINHPTTNMARLSDLPPEIQLKIYQLLLINPIRERLRITLTLDPLHGSRTTWDRASCVQTADPPHDAEHSAHSCHVEAVSSTLHHFDFTDLVSLIRANKLLYAEASQTIFNNADLTVSLSHLSPAGKTISASTLLN